MNRTLLAALGLVLSGGVLTAGCDVLDVKPTASVANEEALDTPRKAEIVLSGVYNALQNTHDLHYIFNEVNSDNALWTGSFPTWQEIDLYNYQATNVDIQGRWSGMYNVINIANNVIDGVPKIGTTATFTATRRKEIVGEAKTLRAYAYLVLVNYFGDVPLVTAPTASVTPDNGFPARKPMSEVYAQIESDLRAAEDSLGTTNKAIAYVDGWAAKALLSRVSLYQQKWAQAEAKATEVIASTQFGLSSLSTLWEGGGGNEILWSLVYVAGTDPQNMSFYAYPSNAGGRYEYAPTANLKAAYAATDGRLAYTIRRVSNADIVGKYFRTTTDDDPVYIIRLAEVYLNRAEARAQQGNATGALADLNVVRARAGLAALSGLTGAPLLDAIYAERRLELAFEGQRWFDLKRTGKAVATLSLPSPERLLWPIPQRERNVNPNLVQNPGY